MYSHSNPAIQQSLKFQAFMVESDGGAADDKILSYGDVVLRRSDLSILSGNHYINDRIIEFYFTYLSPPPPLLLLPPSISFFISHSPDTAPAVVDPLNFHEKSLILFPVNDNADVTAAEGGNHWSLLVFHRHKRTFVHHDSIGGANSRHAKRLFNAVKGLVGLDNPGGNAGAKFEEGPTPLQENGYDCGVYVMAIAGVICKWFKGVADAAVGDDERWFSAVEKEVDAKSVRKLRVEVKKIILNLMEQQS